MDPFSCPSPGARCPHHRHGHPAGLSDRRRNERVRLQQRHCDFRLCRFLSARPNRRPANDPALRRRHRRRGTLMSVELDNVGHKFAASPWLFRHLSARCEDGALTAIIGPSGSGKSTLRVGRLLTRPDDCGTGRPGGRGSPRAPSAWPWGLPPRGGIAWRLPRRCTLGSARRIRRSCNWSRPWHGWVALVSSPPAYASRS